MSESFLTKVKEYKGDTRPLKIVPEPIPSGRPISIGGGGGGGGKGSGKGYAEAALDDEADRVRSAPSGERNHALNRAAFSLGQLVAGGELTEAQVTTTLEFAARSAGLDEGEILATIKSGLGKGMLNPRTAPRTVILRGVYSNPEQVAARWAEPEILEGEIEPAPAFPVETLRGVIGDFARALAANTQTPVDLAAMMLFAGASVATAGRAWVEGSSPDWTEPLVLWTITALPPGSRKSPVVNEIAKPYYALELAADEQHATEAAGKDALLEAAEARQAALVKKLGNPELLADGLARKGLEDDLAATAAEIDELTIAEPTEYLTSDFTPEALAMLLEANGGTIGVLDDEGGVFGNITGRYSSGTPQLDLILKAYDGQKPFKQNRVGRRRVSIPWPTVAIGLAIQPSVLADTTQTPMLRERGLMGRFAYCVPHDTVGTRSNRDIPAMPEHLRAAWRGIVETLTQLPMCAPGEPRTVLRLSLDARENHLDYRDSLEARLHPETGDLAYMSDWAAKHAGRILRIAGILHLLAGHRITDPISFTTMADALDVGEWMTEHAVRVYGGWRKATDAETGGPASILRWIKRTQPESFTARDFQRANQGQTWVDAESVKDALVVLVESGWLASVEAEYADDTKGRRRSTGKFIPHPQLLGVTK